MGMYSKEDREAFGTGSWEVIKRGWDEISFQTCISGTSVTEQSSVVMFGIERLHWKISS